MKIGEMIEEMNKAVDGTLSIAYYTAWELHSYGEGSLFHYPDNAIRSKSFKDLIKKAYKILKEGRKNERKT